MTIAIAGTGITRHGFFAEQSWKDMVVESAYAAMEDAGVEPGQIDGGFVSVTLADIFEQQNLGPVVADELALPPGPFGQIVGACAGGGVAIQAGMNMIASGRHRCVLIVGIEKVSDATATADTMLPYLDAGIEAPAGIDYVDSMALMQQRYMMKYGVDEATIAAFAVQDRWYSSRNDRAFEFARPALDVDTVLASGWVSRPITRAECGKACDGSSAVVLMAADNPALDRDRLVTIAGFGQATGPNQLASKFGHPDSHGDDIAEAVPTRMAAERAYEEAGVGPEDMDVAQVHDCFTIMGSIHLEGLSIFPKGQAARAVADGQTAVDGPHPTNTDGGRIGLGHPTGTTGINVMVETASQLRGEAGERQVDRPTYGVCQSMGGNNSTSVVTVLKRGD